jgi:polysaccharide biosynthesis protein PelG
MAGIGFELRRLSRQDTISSAVASAGHAAVIAAGPWLFTIFALASITLATDQIAGLAVLSNFRAIVIYAFALSLVFSAPATIVATRLVGDALWLKQPERVRSLLLGAYVVTLLPVLVGLGFLLLAIRSSLPVGLVLSAGTLLVSLIWIALAFCGAIRDYTGVTLSFLVGLGVSLFATVAVAIFGYSEVGMAWGFISGLTVTLFGLTSRVFDTFPHPVVRPQDGIRSIVTGMGTFAPLVAGAVAGTAGVWIDKWVFWLSPVGERLGSGLLHAPLYDSTMFIASLGIIPSLSSFVMNLETGFFERYQNYYGTISGNGTLRQIEDARQRLARYTLDNLALIAVSQAALTAIIVLTAPIIINGLGLQYRQIAILRYGTLGAVFQFIFIAATSMLLFFDRRYLYVLLQALFLVLNGGLTWLSLSLGEDYYGVGYFAASMIGAAVAYRLAERTFAALNYLTFIGNNPSIPGPKGVRSSIERAWNLSKRSVRWPRSSR